MEEHLYDTCKIQVINLCRRENGMKHDTEHDNSDAEDYSKQPNLLHLAQRLLDSKLGACLLLDLIDAHTRSQFSQGQASLLSVNFEDALYEC